jgi:uncharacterized SAM-binding protein YcdF (DUF218 family)
VIKRILSGLRGPFEKARNSPKLSLFVIAVVLLGISVTHTACSIWNFEGASPGATAGAAVVLGASVQDDKPSQVYQARIDHAVALYKDGRVKVVILTGGTPPGASVADAEVAREYAITLGLPPEHALAETQSRTTRENLLHAQRIAMAQGIKRTIIVSDQLHLKRAMRIARGLGFACVPSATPTTRYRSRGAKAKFTVRETLYYYVYLLCGK